ncbi:MAG: hypothetical protein V3T41_00485 [bacterium]
MSITRTSSVGGARAVADVAVVVALVFDAIFGEGLQHVGPVGEFLNDGRRADGGDRVVVLQPDRLHVVVLAAIEGRVHRERDELGDMPAEAVCDAHARLRAVERDVEVEAEVYAVAAEGAAVYKPPEARRFDQRPLFHRRRGVDAARDYAQAERCGGLAHHPPELRQRAFDRRGRVAHRRRHLHHAIVEVALDAVGLVPVRDAGQQRVDLVGQRAVGVEERELLLHAEVEFGSRFHNRGSLKDFIKLCLRSKGKRGNGAARRAREKG